jgi:glycosyltransferase involved in cell wall biosynthesis
LLEQKLDQNLIREHLKFKPRFSKFFIRFFGRSIAFDIVSVVLKSKPELVVTTEFGFTTIQLLFLKIILKYDFKIIVMTDDNSYQYYNRNFISKLSRDFCVAKADTVIYTSIDSLDFHKSKIKNHTPNAFYCPIIHSSEVFRKRLIVSLELSNILFDELNLSNKKIVSFVGRLDKVKNVNVLIDAVSQFRSDFSDVIFLIIGDGSELDSLINLTKLNGIEEKFIFLGKIEGIKLLALYNLCQVLVLTSLNEPYGAVVGEALLAGSKVVCSRFAGASALIDDFNGVIIDPRNANEIAAGILFCLRDLEKLSLPIKSIRPNQLRENLVDHLEDLMKFL